MITRIFVTEKDIQLGQSSSAYCPIALALRRYHDGGKGFLRVSARAGLMWWRFDARRRSGYHPYPIVKPLPEAVRQFIAAFDAGEVVEPFAFWLDVPAL